MNYMNTKTMMESAIEQRNNYQLRLVDNMVNVIYFTRKLKELKPDTQERVDAKNAIAQAESQIKNDEKLMEAFDILIASLEEKK